MRELGKSDTLSKNLMRNNSVFADAFNFFLYDGAQVIDPEALTEMDTTELSVASDNVPEYPDTAQKQRDVLKSLALMTDEKTVYVIFGIENQDKLHYAMPVKNMVYDAMQYENQVRKTADRHRQQKEYKSRSSDEFLSGFYEEDRLMPVVTLVVYFQGDEWTAPRSLHEMMGEYDPQIMKFAADYKINLIEPHELSRSDFSKFSTSLGPVLEFLKISSDKGKMQSMMRSGRLDSMPRDAVLLLQECTKTRFEMPEEEEDINMCEAIDQMIQDGVEQGLDRMSRLINILMKSGKTEDVVRVTEDPDYRDHLFVEYRL